MDRRDATALIAAGMLAIITISWWALALWPVQATDTEWLNRLRYVCFGVTRSGLPDASGWLVLTLQPALMFGVLFAVWGSNIRSGVVALGRRPIGRIAYVMLPLMGMALLGSGIVRVAKAMTAANFDFAVRDEGVPDTYPRLDRDAPPFELINQFGETVQLSQFFGRPVLVTFAFGHCQTICPVVVHDVKHVRTRLATLNPVVLVLSLDPWRDTPRRLPFIADQWGLGVDEYALSGPVDAVERVLDAWNVARTRDERTGDITHPRLVFVIDTTGRVAYAASGGVDMIEELVRRVKPDY